MNITLVMSSSITTTLIMAVGPTVGPAVAYSKAKPVVRMNGLDQSRLIKWDLDYLPRRGTHKVPGGPGGSHKTS